jgi:hypothetical protein
MPIQAAMVSLLLTFQAAGQGTFQNLNFEAAQLVPVPGGQYGEVQFAAAFPGWTGYIAGQVQTTTIRNGVPIGQIFPFISIMGPPEWNPPGGDYELGFGAGWDGNNVIPVALAQTGLVPPDAMSLQFQAPYAMIISVFMGGQQLTVVPLNDNIFGHLWSEALWS